MKKTKKLALISFAPIFFLFMSNNWASDISKQEHRLLQRMITQTASGLVTVEYSKAEKSVNITQKKLAKRITSLINLNIDTANQQCNTALKVLKKDSKKRIDYLWRRSWNSYKKGTNNRISSFILLSSILQEHSYNPAYLDLVGFNDDASIDSTNNCNWLKPGTNRYRKCEIKFDEFIEKNERYKVLTLLSIKNDGLPLDFDSLFPNNYISTAKRQCEDSFANLIFPASRNESDVRQYLADTNKVCPKVEVLNSCMDNLISQSNINIKKSTERGTRTGSYSAPFILKESDVSMYVSDIW